MSKIYYGDRASGGSLKHYRTKGSRNGYSKNPNYKAVGQKAKGRWVNGRYVYDQPTNNSMYSKSSSQTKPANVSQEYWDNLQANTNPNYKPESSKPKKGIDTSIDPRYAKRSSQHGTPWVSEEYKQELAYNTGKSYTPKKNAINVNTDPRYKKQQTNTGLKGDPRYSVAGTNKINRAKIEALSKKGAKNDWQQMAQVATRTGADGWRRENTGSSRWSKTLESGSMTPRTKGDKAKTPSAGVVDLHTGKTKMYSHNTDRGYDKAAKKVAQRNYQNSESAKKMASPQKSAINYDDPNTASEYFSGKRADPRFNKSVIKGISGMTYSSIDKYKRAKEIADMKARAKTDAEKKAEQKRIKEGEKRRKKRERATKRQALINKIKSKIKGFFS